MKIDSKSNFNTIDALIWIVCFPLVVLSVVVHSCIFYYTVTGKANADANRIHFSNGQYQLVGKTMIYQNKIYTTYGTEIKEQIKVERLDGKIEYLNKN
jgi:hypothetical protein